MHCARYICSNNTMSACACGKVMGERDIFISTFSTTELSTPYAHQMIKTISAYCTCFCSINWVNWWVSSCFASIYMSTVYHFVFLSISQSCFDSSDITSVGFFRFEGFIFISSTVFQSRFWNSSIGWEKCL